MWNSVYFTCYLIHQIITSFLQHTLYDTDLIPSTLLTTQIPPPYAQYSIFISRNVGAKAYTVMMMMTTWLTSTTLGFTTVASILFGHQILLEVVLLPVVALFAFPQLRSTLPGIPDVSMVGKDVEQQ